MSGIKSSCVATEEMIFSVGGRTTVHLHSAQHGSFKRWPSQPISWLVQNTQPSQPITWLILIQLKPTN